MTARRPACRPEAVPDHGRGARARLGTPPLRLLGVCVAMLLVSAGPSLGHGASEGLHLHLSPEPARPGQTITVEVDGADPLRLVVAGIVDGPWTEAEPDAATRHLELRLKVPGDASGTILAVHAEAETEDGAVVRASAILRLTDRTGRRGLSLTLDADEASGSGCSGCAG